MQKRQMLILAIAIVAAVGGYAVYEHFRKAGGEAFPTRSISNFVFSSAGGGTDQWNRMMSAIMEKDHGQRITVTNMTGGNGGTAAAHVWNADHDGHTWLGCSETITTHPATGSGERLAKDWQFWVMAGSPGVVCVAADSDYKDYGALVKAAGGGGRKIKIGNSGLGKLWHLKAYIAANIGKIPFEHVPYQGSRPAIVACLSGELDAVSCSLGEVVDFIASGKLRPVLMEENEPYDFPGFGRIPSAAEYFPDVKSYFPVNQWLGFAVPADVPDAAKRKMDQAFAKAIADPEIKKFAEAQQAIIFNLTGDAANDMVRRQEAVMSWLLQDLGLATVSPEKFNIKRP